MTYHELVKKVQTALAKADASKVADHIAVQVNVTGEAEGIFYMEISDGVLYVAPYDYNDRDALLTADGADVLAVAQGKVSMETAIAEGKVAHEGDYEKALTLGATIPAKKAAAKKTTVKAADAAETKKTAAKKEKAAKPTRAASKKAKAETAAEETVKAETAAVVEETAKPKKRGRKPGVKKADK